MAQKRNYHGLSDSGVFYRDRDEWMRHLITRDDMEMSARAVGLYLALRVNPVDRKAWPQQATIAKELGLSLPTVKRAVKALVDDGLLYRKQGRRGVKRAVNEYSLIHPADKVSPVIPSESITHDP